MSKLSCSQVEKLRIFYFEWVKPIIPLASVDFRNEWERLTKLYCVETEDEPHCGIES